jgi:hypothetical protein
MSLAVIYLRTGGAFYDTFIESYLKHVPGYSHNLWLAWKTKETYQTSYNAVRVPLKGYSLRSFHEAAKLLTHYEYLCFLNSHSIILADNWLDKLMFGMTLPNAGIVGCTGSNESFSSNNPGFINSLLFHKFPNPHIRTNAFIMRRDIFMKVWPRGFKYKYQEHIFESGKLGLTKRLKLLGLKAYVMGQNGLSYDETQFSFSGTFRAGFQENLLVGDNQTKAFASASHDERIYLMSVTHGIPNVYE